MLEIDRKVLTLNYKTILFGDSTHDIEGCDHVEFVDCKNEIHVKGFTCHAGYTSIIDLTQDLDTLWRNMDKKSTQYEIRRVEREGIGTHINKHFDEFYKINKSLARKQRRTPWFGIGISLEAMKRYGTLFAAEHNGEILGGHLYFEDAAHIRLWLSASKRLEADREKAALIGRANRLLHWEAIKYAKAKGIEGFDWGGLWSEEEATRDSARRNINSFKQSFGGTTVKRFSYLKAYSKTARAARYLYQLVNRVLK